MRRDPLAPRCPSPRARCPDRRRPPSAGRGAMRDAGIRRLPAGMDPAPHAGTHVPGAPAPTAPAGRSRQEQAAWILPHPSLPHRSSPRLPVPPAPLPQKFIGGLRSRRSRARPEAGAAPRPGLERGLITLMKLHARRWKGVGRGSAGEAASKSPEQRPGSRAGGGRSWNLPEEEPELLPERAPRWQILQGWATHGTGSRRSWSCSQSGLYAGKSPRDGRPMAPGAGAAPGAGSTMANPPRMSDPWHWEPELLLERASRWQILQGWATHGTSTGSRSCSWSRLHDGKSSGDGRPMAQALGARAAPGAGSTMANPPGMGDPWHWEPEPLPEWAPQRQIPQGWATHGTGSRRSRSRSRSGLHTGKSSRDG